MQNRLKNAECVEILDTTLRDGEQTPGVSFTPEEKFNVARLLLCHVRVDRLEIGSARVSSGERDAMRTILEWAGPRGFLDGIEILGFIDGGKSVEWVAEAGGKVINLLAKGSEEHCRIQLRKTPRKHFDEIAAEVERADKRGLAVNLYLEDWSRGVRQSFDYLAALLLKVEGLPIRRIMLADTLGVLAPEECGKFITLMRQTFGRFHFDFHGHNDYGLVTANTLAAVRAGVSGIHTTINGLGERAGNQPLAQAAVAIHDMSGRSTHVVEKELQRASELVQSISGKRCAWNHPVVGSDVFTQTCGVHADGDLKGALYANALRPERFGRHRDYALGKLSGRASLEQNLADLHLDFEPEVQQRILEEIVRLGDRKKGVTSSDLGFIISGVLRTPLERRLRIVDYRFVSGSGTAAKADVTVEYEAKTARAEARGDGGYDAFMKALKKALKSFEIKVPKLLDYQLRIPPGGKTDAIVEVTITWSIGGRQLVTTGLDSDQIVAAVLATEKVLNSPAMKRPAERFSEGK